MNSSPINGAPRRRYFSKRQRAIDPLLSEEDTNTIFHELIDRRALPNRDLRIPPFLECGAPARDVVVADYLMRSREEFPVPSWARWAVAFAFLGMMPVFAADETLPKIGVLVASICAIIAAYAWEGTASYRMRLLRYVEEPTERFVARVGLTYLERPNDVERSTTMRPSYKIIIVLLDFGALYVQAEAASSFFFASNLQDSTPAILWSVILIVGSICVGRMPGYYSEVTRSFQAPWIDYAARVRSVQQALETDDSEDARLWAQWVLSTDRRKPSASPEQDI